MYRLCDKFLLSVAVMYTFVLIYRILFISVRNTQINTPQNHVINILFWYVDKSWKSKKNYSWKFSVQREITCIFNLSLEFYDSFQLISSDKHLKRIVLICLLLCSQKTKIATNISWYTFNIQSWPNLSTSNMSHSISFINCILRSSRSESVQVCYSFIVYCSWRSNN
jgi:hypothetical protein